MPEPGGWRLRAEQERAERWMQPSHKSMEKLGLEERQKVRK